MSGLTLQAPRGRVASHNERWFARALAAVTLAAFAIRVAYVLIERANISFGGDAYFYHAGANLLAHGHGFIQPYFYRNARQIVQAADHPPLYLVFLAIPSVLGMTSILTHLLWSCVLGTATVLVIGLIGQTVWSARVGLIAAIIAAVYPNIWVPDGSLQAETAAMFTTALALFLAYRYLQRPSGGRLVAVGAACGAAALTRSELILLVPFVLVPLAFSKRTRSVQLHLRWLGAAILAMLVVIGPWVGYNLTRFRHPVYLSSQFEVLLASANCDTTYHGTLLGYFSVPCAAAIAHRDHISGDQSQEAVAYRHAAVDYILHHKARLPVVVAARLGRILGVYRPGQTLVFDEFLDRREKSVARGALLSFYALTLLSIAGAFILYRRRVRTFPLLAAPAVVLITVALTYANTRFRAPAEVTLAVLAAVTIDSVIKGLRERRRSGRGHGTTGHPETTPPPSADHEAAEPTAAARPRSARGS